MYVQFKQYIIIYYICNMNLKLKYVSLKKYLDKMLKEIALKIFIYLI